MRLHRSKKKFQQNPFQIPTKPQLGAGAIEYALTLGVLVLLIVGISSKMQPDLDGFFNKTVDCISSFSESGDGCGINTNSTSNDSSNTKSPGSDSNNTSSNNTGNRNTTLDGNSFSSSDNSSNNSSDFNSTANSKPTFRNPIPESSRTSNTNTKSIPTNSNSSNNGSGGSSTGSGGSAGSGGSNSGLVGLSGFNSTNNSNTVTSDEDCDTNTSRTSETQSNCSGSDPQENINENLANNNTRNSRANENSSDSNDSDSNATNTSDSKEREETTRDDRRQDREIESDRRWRREEGANGDTGHLANDWAGRSILSRYLTGGGDWHIDNDPDWSEYMQANSILTNDLRNRAIEDSQSLFQSNDSSAWIDENYHTNIENGEGVVGYQYLHGTNGGFDREGALEIQRHSDGSATVTLEMEYTWNDVIDPNPQYNTDNWKNFIAEGITLGRADPYEISITWTETTVVELDPQGNPTSISNLSNDSD